MPFRVDAKRNAITGSVLSVLDVLLSSFVLLGRCANQIRALAIIAKGAEDGAEASIARCSEMLNVVRMSRLIEASAVSGEARSSHLRVRQALRRGSSLQPVILFSWRNESKCTRARVNLYNSLYFISI